MCVFVRVVAHTEDFLKDFFVRTSDCVMKTETGGPWWWECIQIFIKIDAFSVEKAAATLFRIPPQTEKQAVLLGYLKPILFRLMFSLNEVILTDGEMHWLAVFYSVIINLWDRGLLLSVWPVIHCMMFCPGDYSRVNRISETEWDVEGSDGCEQPRSYLCCRRG